MSHIINIINYSVNSQYNTVVQIILWCFAHPSTIFNSSATLTIIPSAHSPFISCHGDQSRSGSVKKKWRGGAPFTQIHPSLSPPSPLSLSILHLDEKLSCQINQNFHLLLQAAAFVTSRSSNCQGDGGIARKTSSIVCTRSGWRLKGLNAESYCLAKFIKLPPEGEGWKGKVVKLSRAWSEVDKHVWIIKRLEREIAATHSRNGLSQSLNLSFHLTDNVNSLPVTVEERKRLGKARRTEWQTHLWSLVSRWVRR